MVRERGGWLDELDYLRGFAILAIVTIHVGAFYTTIGYPSIVGDVANYLTHLADYGVPVFFFISGFVLAMRYFERLDVRSFYRRRLVFILPPYLAFSALYLVYDHYAFGTSSISEAAWSVALFNAVGIFWFVAVLLQLYLLFPLLTRWQRRSEARGRPWEPMAVSLALYAAWYGVLEGWTADALNAIAQPVPGFGEIVAGRVFLVSLPFFVLGIYLQRQPEVTSSLYRRAGTAAFVPVALGLAVVLTFLGQGFWWALVVVPFSVIMLALLHRASVALVGRPVPGSRLVRTMGVYSFGVYLVHILVIAAVVNRLWAVGLGAEDAVFYILLMLGTVLGSIAFLFIVNLLPFGERLTGVKASSRHPRKTVPKGEAEAK